MPPSDWSMGKSMGMFSLLMVDVRGKGLFHCRFYSPSWRQELKKRPWRIDCCLLACSTCSHKLPRTNCPEVAPPTVVWTLPHQSRRRAGQFEAFSPFRFRNQTSVHTRLPPADQRNGSIKYWGYLMEHEVQGSCPLLERQPQCTLYNRGVPTDENKIWQFFFVVMLGIEPRTLHLLSNYYTPELEPRPLFGNLRSAGWGYKGAGLCVHSTAHKGKGS